MYIYITCIKILYVMINCKCLILINKISVFGDILWKFRQKLKKKTWMISLLNEIIQKHKLKLYLINFI